MDLAAQWRELEPDGDKCADCGLAPCNCLGPAPAWEASLAVHRRVALPPGVDLDELLNAAQGPAIDAFVSCRIDALQQGRDRAYDRDLPAAFLASAINGRLVRICELIGRGRVADARHQAAVAGGMLLALHDRLEGDTL
jgi:hypothetical protein